MKLVGQAFLARFGGRTSTPTPRCSPAFPGMHGPRDALAYGVKVTGATLFFVDEGVDTGPIVAQVAVPVPTTTTSRRCTNASRTSNAACSSTGSAAWSATGFDHRRTGRSPSGRERSMTTRPLKRALDLGLRQDRSGGAGPRSARRGRRDRVDRFDRQDDRGGRRARHTGRGADRFPECLDGRVKTLHPRVHAGILADLRLDDHVEQLADLEIEPFDLVIVNLYPFRETVLSGATPDECVEQIDIGGPSMVRAAAKNHPSVAVVVVAGPLRRGAFGHRGRWVHARANASDSRPRHSHIPPLMTSRSPRGSPARMRLPMTWWPEFTGATWEKSAVLRYGENPHQPAALYRALARWPGRRRAAARQGDVLQQLRRHRCRAPGRLRLRAAGRRDHQARQPVRHRGRCRRREAHARAHACDPVSAYGGVIAANRPVSVGDGEPGCRGVHRGHRRARLRGRRARDAAGQEEHPNPAGCGR